MTSGTKGDLNVWYVSGKKHAGVILVANLLLENDCATHTLQLCGAHFSWGSFFSLVSPNSLIVRLGPNLNQHLQVKHLVSLAKLSYLTLN